MYIYIYTYVYICIYIYIDSCRYVYIHRIRDLFLFLGSSLMPEPLPQAHRAMEKHKRVSGAKAPLGRQRSH